MALLFIVMPVTGEDNLPVRLPFSDEGERDGALSAFRQQMIESVKFREPERFVTLVDLGVVAGYQGESGMQAFARKWRIDAIDSPLWPTMETILQLGGGFVRSNRGVQFCTPYVFVDFPEHLDIRVHGAVIRDDARLMEEPSISANILGQLNRDLVRVSNWQGVDVPNGDGGVDNWVEVRTLSGQAGWLPRNEVRSPLDPHACFLFRGGKWSMNTLVNGWEGLAPAQRVASEPGIETPGF